MNSHCCQYKDLRTIEHVIHRLPVTAVAFFADDLLLCGEGSRLSVYDVGKERILGSAQVFSNNVVHGIIIVDPKSRSLLIYGGRYIRMARLSRSEDDEIVTIEFGGQLVADDWVLDACLVPSLSGSTLPQVALITAHNALYSVSADDPGETTDEPAKWTIYKRLSGSNCILYSAHATWTNDNRLLVASGTAFGDIVVWSCELSRSHDPAEASDEVALQIHHNFAAHEGSVFGVRLSSDIEQVTFDGHTRLLASCSDDRTVRLWDLSDLSPRSATLVDLQRSTGFGTRPPTGDFTPPLLAKAMGHQSRIWHVRFCSISGTLKLKSFGEDATSITWDVRSSDALDGLPYSLKQSSIISGHEGKNIWSVTSELCGQTATGGADGAIAILDFGLDNGTKTAELSNGPTLLSAIDPESDSIKSYTFIDDQTLFTSTQRGRLVICEVGADDQNDVDTIHHSEDLQNYSVVAGLPGLVFAGGSGGRFHVYDHNKHRSATLHCSNGKIAGMFVCKESGSSEAVALLVTTINSTTAQLYTFDPSGHDLSASSTREVTIPAGFIVTSFARLNCDEERDAFTVLGSRNGSLAINHATADVDAGNLTDWHLVSEIHKKEAVTALRWHSASGERGLITGYLYSTGRDGTYAVHRAIQKDVHGRLTLELVHQLELPFGPNIEDICLVSGSEELLVWGFKSKHFVVYSASSQREIMTVECGGAHRNWAFRPLKSGQGGTFVWTKASKVFSRTQYRLPCKIINFGGHGREIKSLAISRCNGLIATGAEDTDIRLHAYRENPRTGDRELKCLQLLRKHNTGPQHLVFSSDGKYLFSSGGFEEFFVWKIEREVPAIGIGVICESIHPHSGKSDLRITSFDVREEADGSGTRSWQIALAYSDSRIVVWRYESTGRWHHLADAEYLTACPTVIFSLSNIASDPQNLLTTATDGHIALWRGADGGMTWTSRHKAHQSAILSALTLNLADGSILVITGGDDNAISFTFITGHRIIKADSATLTIPKAHAAAVTTLVVPCVKRVGEVEMLYLLSAGLDQRVRLWRVEIDVAKDGVEGVDITKARSYWTGVADVAGLDVLETDKEDKTMARVVVAGVGMEILKVHGNLLDAV